MHVRQVFFLDFSIFSMKISTHVRVFLLFFPLLSATQYTNTGRLWWTFSEFFLQQPASFKVAWGLTKYYFHLFFTALPVAWREGSLVCWVSLSIYPKIVSLHFSSCMKYFHPFSTQRRCELGNSLCTSKAAWRVRQCAEVRALDPQSHQQLHQQVRQPWWIESTQQERTKKSQTSLMCFS